MVNFKWIVIVCSDLPKKAEKAMALAKRSPGSTRFFKPVIAFISFLIINSCSLNLQPPVSSPVDYVLSSIENLEAAVNGAYSTMMSAYGYAYKPYADLMSDHIQVSQPITASNLNVYQRNFGPLVATNAWSSGYLAVNQANNVIYAFDNNLIQDNNTDYYRNNKDRLRGESYFIRGIMNFEMVRFYGLPYGSSCYASYKSQNSDGTNNGYGIVLRTLPTQQKQNAPRASTNDVYVQILSDLKLAAALLPAKYIAGIYPVSYQFRATQAAAYAFLAKVYFQTGRADYLDSAVKYCNLALNGTPTFNATNNFPLEAINVAPPNVNYGPYKYSGPQQSQEVIFQMISQYTDDGITGSAGMQAMFSNPSASDPSSPGPQYSCSNGGVSVNILSNISFSGGGFSPSYYFASNADNRYGLLGKYFTPNSITTFGTYKYTTILANIPVVRSAEILLIRAECNILQSNLSEAITDLITLKTRAFGNQAAITAPNISQLNAYNQSQLLNEVILERVREMNYEGDRLHNVKRMGAWNKQNPGLINYPVGQTQFLYRGSNTRYYNWDDAGLLLLIPDAEIFANPDVDRGNDCI